MIDNITELYCDDTAGISAYGKLRQEDSNSDNKTTSSDANFGTLLGVAQQHMEIVYV